jgi:hypothetical protein
MPVDPISPGHLANRTAKAVRLMVFLQDMGGAFADPGVVGLLSDARWKRIAEMAGENPPSRDTVIMVVTMMRELRTKSDPFDGLPKAAA